MGMMLCLYVSIYMFATGEAFGGVVFFFMALYRLYLFLTN